MWVYRRREWDQAGSWQEADVRFKLEIWGDLNFFKRLFTKVSVGWRKTAERVQYLESKGASPWHSLPGAGSRVERVESRSGGANKTLPLRELPCAGMSWQRLWGGKDGPQLWKNGSRTYRWKRRHEDTAFRVNTGHKGSGLGKCILWSDKRQRSGT